MQPLRRFFSPKAVVVIGGGTWCENVVQQCRDTGFTGDIWPVHPKKDTIGGLPAYRDLATLPYTPDAAFIGVNRKLTVEMVRQLSLMGCGGAICFAAGYSEAAAELSDGAALQAALVQAAGDMRILGPNCYGVVNALDNLALWPDLHGMQPRDTGVAIVGQSSNVLINLTMQQRALPLAMVVAAGNQAQTCMSDIGIAVLEDPRITALGLHIEGITDLPAFEALARRAMELNKPIVALRVGVSEQAQTAAVSHTASLVGSAAGARALLARLGIAQVETPCELVETLKLLHVTGGLKSAQIASASCSGGEASLMADIGAQAGVLFPPLKEAQSKGLRTVLGPKVALANPLDYNTYIWGDQQALTDCFTALCSDPDLALACIVLDLPRSDRFEAAEFQQVIHAAAAAQLATGTQVALVSLLPDGLSETMAQLASNLGLVPLSDMRTALRAIRAAADVTHLRRDTTNTQPVLHTAVSTDPANINLIGEAEAKQMLMQAGLRVPHSKQATFADGPGSVAASIGFPVVLKGQGIAHKTEAGAVQLNLNNPEAVDAAADAMPTDSFLIEEMITGTVAELLIGVTRDPAHGFVLTMGLGGILTELIKDTTSVLIPSSTDQIRAALTTLQTAPVLSGYRGRPAANIYAAIETIMALQRFVETHADTLYEIEINPLLCRTHDAVAADALIRMGPMT